MRGSTILFSGHDFRFLQLFVAHCEKDPRYSVIFDEHHGHDISNPAKSRELLSRADLVFCEWCLGNAVWYSRNKLPWQRLVVRLHAQEMRLQYLEQVNWEAVDALVTICPRNHDLILERFPFLARKTHLIYNSISCSLLNQPKLPGAEFNLGIMGICPMLKAPHLAFEILLRLKQIDGRYTLFVKGKHAREYDWLWRRPIERAYYEQFYSEIDRSPHGNSVVFETYGDDVSLWFSKIGFILSTSDFEGSHQSVAEGMASGAIPIIRNWPGSELLYPAKYVVTSVEEAVAAILRWKQEAEYEQEAAFCRTYAQQCFDEHVICDKLETILKPEADRKSEPHSVAESSTAAPDVMVLCYLPPGFSGGYRIRIEQEIKGLISRGCAVHLACLHPKTNAAAALQEHRSGLEALGCWVHLTPLTGFFDINLDPASVRSELEALQTIIQGLQLRIIHAEALYCGRIGLFLKDMCPGLNLVFDCHGTGPEEERLSGAHPARIAAMQNWERRVLIAADLNVFVSEAMSRFYVSQYGLPELPHVVVPCCVSDERFPRADTTSTLAVPPDRPVIAYLGTMAAWQCGEEMVGLLAQLHKIDLELFFLLLVPQADQAKARELILKHQLPEKSFLLAELPHDQVAPALQRAHAGLLLRRAHPVNRVSSPTKFGEYLAAGLPVIMTDGIGDFSQLGAEQRVGLVLPSALVESGEYPASTISGIIEFTRASMNQRGAVAVRCQAVARDHLHWHNALDRLLAGYRQVLQFGVEPLGLEKLSAQREVAVTPTPLGAAVKG
jgi:glycosyltransferase involved in cell wall biosynthesis